MLDTLTKKIPKTNSQKDFLTTPSQMDRVNPNVLFMYRQSQVVPLRGDIERFKTLGDGIKLASDVKDNYSRSLRFTCIEKYLTNLEKQGIDKYKGRTEWRENVVGPKMRQLKMKMERKEHHKEKDIKEMTLRERMLHSQKPSVAGVSVSEESASRLMNVRAQTALAKVASASILEPPRFKFKDQLSPQTESMPTQRRPQTTLTKFFQ